MEGFLTVTQLARLAGVAQGTVYRWLDDDDVPLTKHKSGNGRVWISEAEARRYIEERTTPVAVPVRSDAES